MGHNYLKTMLLLDTFSLFLFGPGNSIIFMPIKEYKRKMNMKHENTIVYEKHHARLWLKES